VRLAADGQDGNGVQLEKISLMCSSFPLVSCKNRQNLIIAFLPLKKSFNFSLS